MQSIGLHYCMWRMLPHIMLHGTHLDIENSGELQIDQPMLVLICMHLIEGLAQKADALTGLALGQHQCILSQPHAACLEAIPIPPNCTAQHPRQSHVFAGEPSRQYVYGSSTSVKKGGNASYDRQAVCLQKHKYPIALCPLV